MNIYAVLEGESAAKQIYKSWICKLNPVLTVVDYIEQITTNSVLLMAGGGCPSYFDVIERAIQDVNAYPFDRLVVALDSEDMGYQDKFNEVQTFIASRNLQKDCRIVVQHFCFETWALSNPSIIPRHPNDVDLASYKATFDVTIADPELLPPLPSESLTRAQFAYKYLRKAVREKSPKYGYTKSAPGPVAENVYFDRVRTRHTTTSHIQSFAGFLNAFV